MRSVGVIVACVGLLLAGCEPQDTRYFRYGIGTELYSADIVQATQYQDIYLNELCRQALPVVSTPESVCLSGYPGPNGWNLIIQAGMNDIDRRCDSYLAWLDDRRRTNAAVLKELGDVAVASQAIMRVAGVSANPIVLAGLAFGLAADTFTNVNSRLLLEVDKTTVQTLVLRRRSDYRLWIQNQNVDSRPATVHALRSYLNICTPFAIETDINSTVTVLQVTGLNPLDRPPLIDPATVKGVTIVRARDPLLKRDFVQVRERLKPAFITNVRDALCISEAGSASGEATTKAIGGYLQGLRRSPPANIDPTSAEMRPLLQRAIDDVGNCRTAGFRNAFEVGRYGIPAGNSAKRINDFQRKLAAYLASKNSTVAVTQTSKFDDQTRAGIKEVRRLNNTGVSDELDSDTNRLIVSF